MLSALYTMIYGLDDDHGCHPLMFAGIVEMVDIVFGSEGRVFFYNHIRSTESRYYLKDGINVPEMWAELMTCRTKMP